MNDVRYPVPFAEKLADLLLIHFERERDLVIVFGWFSLDHRHVQSAARSRVQNAHQRSLRVAIANVKLHVYAP